MNELQRGLRATMGIYDDNFDNIDEKINLLEEFFNDDEKFFDNDIFELEKGLRELDICETQIEQCLDNICDFPEVLCTCKTLQNTSSTIEKQSLLEECADELTYNKAFREILKFLLDNQIVTGISKKKIEKKVPPITIKDMEVVPYDIISLLEYLKTHNTGTDKDIAQCQMFLNLWNDDCINNFLEKYPFYMCSEKCRIRNNCNIKELQDLIKSIITKSLKLGIDVKTANKVYGKDFIPVLNVMLGTSIEKCKIPQGTWFSISQKLNGSRCFYYKGKLYTRQGKVYTGCEHIIKDIESLFIDYLPHNYVFDGELILKDRSLVDSEAFQKGVGIANSNQENKEELKLVIFDMLTSEEFEIGKSVYTYSQRKEQLIRLKEIIKQFNLSNIEIVPMFYEGTDQSKIWKWLDYAEENDMEGVMVNLDTPYQCKRTKDLMKVKKFYTLDLEVVDAVEGDGRLKGTLGALVVDYKGNTVNVGSGFSDKQRKEFWENKDNIVGRVIEVKYKEITKNKDTGLESLQFPVFVSLREQGKEVSYD